MEFFLFIFKKLRQIKKDRITALNLFLGLRFVKISILSNRKTKDSHSLVFLYKLLKKCIMQQSTSGLFKRFGNKPSSVNHTILSPEIFKRM